MHPITEPEKTVHLNLAEFWGIPERDEEEVPDPENSRWGFNYGVYPSKEDARKKTNRTRLFGRVTVKGDLLARFLLTDDGSDWTMERAKVGALLHHLLTQDLAWDEWQDVCNDGSQQNLVSMRTALAGQTIFGGAITVAPFVYPEAPGAKE